MNIIDRINKKLRVYTAEFILDKYANDTQPLIALYECIMEDVMQLIEEKIKDDRREKM